MRILTVTRKKSFVGCLATIKLCMEVPEHESHDIVIDGKRCRILAKLKNGKTESIQVGDDAFKLYAIADNASTSFCREFYTVEAGTEDVCLSGACVFNPARGNAFSFDGNDTAEVVADRKKSQKKGTVILAIALTVGIIAGVFAGYFLTSLWLNDRHNPTPKDFHVDALTVTLDSSFKHVDSDNEAMVVFASNSETIVLSVEKPTASVDFGEQSEAEIGELLIASNYYPAGAKLIDDSQNGLVYIEYANEQSKYMMVIKKNGNDVWLCHFGSLADSFEDDLEWMIQAAKTIKFDT